MFALEVLMINEFEGLKLHCTGHEFAQVPIASQPGVFKEFCGITTGEEYLDSVLSPHHPRPLPRRWRLVAHACAIHQLQISFSSDNMVRDAMLLLGFYFIFIFITCALVKFLKWQKR
jgi:hypothetical protein